MQVNYQCNSCGEIIRKIWKQGVVWFVEGTDERPGLDWVQLGRGTWETGGLLDLHLQDLRDSGKELGFFILQ